MYLLQIMQDYINWLLKSMNTFEANERFKDPIK